MKKTLIITMMFFAVLTSCEKNEDEEDALEKYHDLVLDYLYNNDSPFAINYYNYKAQGDSWLDDSIEVTPVLLQFNDDSTGYIKIVGEEKHYFNWYLKSILYDTEGDYGENYVYIDTTAFYYLPITETDSIETVYNKNKSYQDLYFEYSKDNTSKYIIWFWRKETYVTNYFDYHYYIFD